MGEYYNFSWENPSNIIEDGEIIYDAEEILPISTQEITCDTQLTDTSPRPSESEKDMQDDKLYLSSDDIFIKQLSNGDKYLEFPIENQIIEETVIDQWVGDITQEIVANELTIVDDNQYQIPLQQDEYSTLRPHPCDFCNKRFRNKTNLINHLASHQKTQNHHESEEFGFINKNELSGHKNIHENESKFSMENISQSYICSHCGEGFIRERDLNSHLRQHEVNPPFPCQKCKKNFSNLRLLVEHQRIVHGHNDNRRKVDLKHKNKFGTYSCITCGKSFCRQDDLKRHQQIHIDDLVDDSESEFTCKVCCETFAEPLDLLAHAEEHARGFEFSCMVCSENFIDEETCALHLKEQHPEEEGLHCNKCPRIFYDVSRLEKHLLSHKDESFMTNVSHQKSNRYNDIGKSSDMPFSCRECGKYFATRSSQQIHMRIHTGERPYSCSFCDKAFADGGTLRKHERIHTGEKPYACVICPKAFNQRVVLREHIRSHHSGPDPNYSDSMTPFRCTICLDMFSESQDLIVHLIHHCDINTAMKRKPKVGPRKYVRRSKLKSQQAEYLSNSMKDVQDQEEYYFENESGEETQHQQSGMIPKYEIDMDTNQMKRARKVFSDHDSEQFEDTNVDQEISYSSTPTLEFPTYPEMENREELRDSSAVTSRAKMIHTEKKPKSMNPIETRGRKRKKNIMQEISSPKFVRNVRPRTKNVSYPSPKHDKPPVATFPVNNSRNERKKRKFQDKYYYEQTEGLEENEGYTSDERVPQKRAKRKSRRKSKNTSNRNMDLDNIKNAEETQKLNEEQSIGDFDIKHEYEQCEQQIVYETPELYAIPEDHSETIIKDNVEASEYANTYTLKTEDQDFSAKQEIIDPLLELAEISMQHAKSLHKCEMCNSVFLEKSQLINHVSIHI